MSISRTEMNKLSFPRIFHCTSQTKCYSEVSSRNCNVSLNSQIYSSDETNRNQFSNYKPKNCINTNVIPFLHAKVVVGRDRICNKLLCRFLFHRLYYLFQVPLSTSHLPSSRPEQMIYEIIFFFFFEMKYLSSKQNF